MTDIEKGDGVTIAELSSDKKLIRIRKDIMQINITIRKILQSIIIFYSTYNNYFIYIIILNIIAIYIK